MMNDDSHGLPDSRVRLSPVGETAPSSHNARFATSDRCSGCGGSTLAFCRSGRLVCAACGDPEPSPVGGTLRLSAPATFYVPPEGDSPDAPCPHRNDPVSCTWCAVGEESEDYQ